VGLISYSLYLWHWPLIILRRELTGGAPFNARDLVLYLALTALLSWATWRFIERPFRGKRMARGRVFAWTGGGVAGLAAAGVALFLSVGLPQRFSPEVVRMAAWLDYSPDPAFQTGRCFLNTRYDFEDFDKAHCLAAAPDRPNVLLVGDSYGAHLHHGLSTVLTEARVLHATAAGCKPSAKEFYGLPGCTRLARFMVEEHLPAHPVDLIVVSGFWEDGDAEALTRYLDWARARSIPVVVVGRPPEYDLPLPSLIAKSLQEEDPGLPARHALKDIVRIDAKYRLLTEAHGAGYASLIRTLCPSGPCQTETAGAPVQYDQGHFTRQGSELVVRRLREAGAFDALKVRSPVRSGDVAELTRRPGGA
jgi:hypothetical protein